MTCRCVYVGFASLVFASVLGCGADTGGRVAISGTVTMKGVPLENGTIEFVSTDGNQKTGAAIGGGSYSIAAENGLLPGKFTVRVSAVKEGAINQEEAPGDSSVSVTNQELIPPEYNVNSTLTADIAAGSSATFDVSIP